MKKKQVLGEKKLNQGGKHIYHGKKSVRERKRHEQQLLFIFCFLLQNIAVSLIIELGCYVQNTIKIYV